MTKLKVTRTFESGGDTYKRGKTYLVTEKVAKGAEEAGHGTRVSRETKPEGDVPRLRPAEEMTEPSEPEDIWEELKREAKAESEKPPNWRPERGDWLYGAVENVGEGEMSRFAVVKVAKSTVGAREKLGEDKYAEKRVGPGGRVLLWELKDLTDLFDKLKAGSKIAVQYTGKMETSSGHDLKLFDYAVREA